MAEENYGRKLTFILGVCYCGDCDLIYKAASVLCRMSTDEVPPCITDKLYSFEYNIPSECLRYPDETFADWVERICLLPE